MIRKTFGFVLLAMAAMMFGGCAESIGDINRVQPNYYSKKNFEGNWYYRQTVIDVPYENSYLFNGIGSDVEKIRWEIQEKTLIAYRVNELIFDANGEPTTGKEEFTPVSAWAITSHFDIVREYNTGTGEQYNVISENMSDRPWYERDYIRVDWSRNLIPNQNGLDTFLGMNMYGKATPYMMTGANYWVQAHEEDNPDRFEISDRYIGVVGRYNVEPDNYTCYLAFNNMWRTGSGFNCGPSTIKIRSSFVKIDEKAPVSYQPLKYDDRQPLFAEIDLNGDGKVDNGDRIDRKLRICADISPNGSSCTKYVEIACNQDIINRLGADPFYGRFAYTIDDCRDASPTYFEKFGYFRTEHLTYDRDRGLTNTGRVNFANRWNIWENALDTSGNPIPYAQRKVKPIEFYLNADFPEDLYGAAAEIERQWNEAFKETVAALQGKSVDEVDDVYKIHPNSCSPQNLRTFVAGNKSAQRIAKRVIGGIDNLNFSNQERLCTALEYNLGSDKFTWQKNGDLRYSFVYWVDRPQRAGPLGFGPSYADPDTGELISGTAYVYGASVDSYAAYATDLIELLAGRTTEEQIIGGDSIRDNVFGNIRRAAENRYDIGDIPDSFFEEMNRRGAKYDAMHGELPKITREQFDARLALIKGTEIERQLSHNEPMLSLLVPGYKPGDTVSAEQLEAISPANIFSSAASSLQEKHLLHLTEKHCTLMADFVDDSIIGLAMEFAGAEDLTRDEIYTKVREQIFIGVMLHEIGHTLGLRHNFNGSADALNYHPEFWKYAQLDEDPRVAKSSPDLDADEVATLDQCIARAEAWGIPTPSTLDCMKASELKQSSIMDYGARFNSDFRGLGAYDKAAIAFGYGQLVEVFEEDVQLPNLPLDSVLFTDSYTKIPDHLGGVDRIHSRKLVSYDEVNKDRAAMMIDAAYNLPRISMINGDAGCKENCDRIEVSREVPYMFCTDNFARWRLYCDRWDQGASQTEIVQSAVDEFRNYYIFNAFKRDRFNWSYGPYVNRMIGRTFPHINNAFVYYFLYWRYPSYRNFDLVKDLAVASAIGLNLYGEILQSPEAGWACKHPTEDLYLPAERWSSTCDATVPDSVRVPQGLGRHYWTDYSDDYHYEPLVVPGFLEKVYTIIGLTQSDARYFRVSESDSSTTTVNFYRIFKDEILSLLGGLVTEDIPSYSGRVVEEDGEKVYRPRLVVDPYTFGSDFQEEGTPILSESSYDLRWYALYFGMAFLTTSVDQTLDFRNYFKVSLKGSYDDIEYGGIDKNDPDQYIEFTEPNSRFTYYAIATDDGHSYGYKMVQKAKEVYDRPVNGWKAVKDTLDALDPNSETYAADRALWEARLEEVNQELLWRVEFLDSMRLFQRVFEFGNGR